MTCCETSVKCNEIKTNLVYLEVPLLGVLTQIWEQNGLLDDSPTLDDYPTCLIENIINLPVGPFRVLKRKRIEAAGKCT